MYKHRLIWLVVSSIYLISPALPYNRMPAATREPATNSLYLPIVADQADLAWRWQPAEEITLSPSPNTNSAQWLAIDPAGAVYIFWDTLTSPRWVYWTQRLETGWTPAAPISPTLGSATLLEAPVMGPSGDLHLVWKAYFGAGQAYPWRLFYAGQKGGAWEARLVYSGTVNSSLLMGWPEVDGAGNPQVVYIDSIVSESPAYQTALTPSGWTQPVKIDPGFSSFLTVPGQRGDIHFFGEDVYNQILSYSHWDGGHFQVQNHSMPGDVLGVKGRPDGQGNVYMYEMGTVLVPGGSVTGVWLQCLDSLRNLSPLQAVSGEAAVRGTVQTATDGDAQVALGWVESQANRLWLTVWEDCQMTRRASVLLPAGSDWELRAVAVSRQPRRTCVLGKKLYSQTFLLQCADF